MQAPRFKAFYRYRCGESACGGHRQGLIDWEPVAFQRRQTHLSDDRLNRAIRDEFLGELCAPSRDVAFYVGNQA